VEDLSLHGATLDDGALVAGESIEACLKECVDRRRNDDLALARPLASHRQHLVDEERVPLRGDDDALPRLVVDRVGRERVDQPVAVFVAERFKQQ
jgi:hypothetical protein